MKKLKKYLSQWVDKGLITSEQEQKILEYEETKDKDNKSKWVLYGFLILGVTVVGIGIISLIAANWDKIPGIVKLMNMLIILCGVAFVILKKGKPSDKIEKNIKSYVDKKIGPTARPAKIYFVNSLPKTRSGKIMRRILKAILTGDEIKGVSTLMNPQSVDEIKEIVKSSEGK